MFYLQARVGAERRHGDRREAAGPAAGDLRPRAAGDVALRDRARARRRRDGARGAARRPVARGRLSIGFDQEQDRFVLEIDRVRADEVEDEDDRTSCGPRSTTTRRSIRLWATREQMFALSRYGVGGGRARAADLPVLREPDRPGGPRVSGHERAPEAAGLSDAAPRRCCRARWSCSGLLPERVERTRFLARCATARATRSSPSTSRGGARPRCGTSLRARCTGARSRPTGRPGARVAERPAHRAARRARGPGLRPAVPSASIRSSTTSRSTPSAPTTSGGRAVRPAS